MTKPQRRPWWAWTALFALSGGGAVLAALAACEYDPTTFQAGGIIAVSGWALWLFSEPSGASQ
jgi:hypothetical protein